jgi:hypothetical protein
MKKILLSIFITFVFGLSAQKIPNASYTDCNGNTQDIYSVLASGKVLMIASKGLDCSICMSHASGYESFIDQNKATIAGWGAMVFNYKTDVPTCSEITSWNTTYGWNQIFSFADSNKDFLVSGTPRYYVVNPADSAVVYNGGNFNTAQQTALQYASSISIKEKSYFADLKVFRQNEAIALKTSVSIANNSLAILYNITGQKEQVWSEFEASPSGYRLSLNKNLNSGVYLLRLTSNGKEVTKKLVWAN